MPFGADFQADYDALKKAHPGDIVLYQMGDFYEIFGPDARATFFELDLMLTDRIDPNLGRVVMCGFPVHGLDKYVQKLRERYAVTISSIGADGKRLTASYLSVEHEARKAHEAETAAPEDSAPLHVSGGTPPIPVPPSTRETTQEEIDAAIREQLESGNPSAFVEQVMADVEQIAASQDVPVPEPAPTVREIYEKYKPIVKNLVLADAAYQNACKNSDRDTAIIEGDAALKRAALTITEAEFMRLYYDTPPSPGSSRSRPPFRSVRMMRPHP